MNLTSERHEVDSDIVSYTQLAVERGWGDGLPLIPPTIERVEAYIEAANAEPDLVLGTIPPLNGECTVERLAINAVMGGAPAGAMPLLMASVRAVTEPDFELFGLNATTAPVVPALFVNGPARHELNISFGAGCMGGNDGTGAAIGRALRLVMRNVGGQRVGSTSKSVYGTPGRTAGIVFAEWEEQSPWAPLAERRGASGNAVTAFAANGTMNIHDNTGVTAEPLLQQIGKSLAYAGSNGYRAGAPYTTVFVGLNPLWAQLIGKEYPNVEDVQQRLWDWATLPMDTWTPEYQARLVAGNHVSEDGLAHVVRGPDRILVGVCGGRGGLHALAIHGPGSCVPMTKSF